MSEVQKPKDFEEVLGSALKIKDVEERVAFILQQENKDLIQNRIKSYRDTRWEIAQLFELDEKVIIMNFKNPKTVNKVVMSRTILRDSGSRKLD